MPFDFSPFLSKQNLIWTFLVSKFLKKANLKFFWDMTPFSLEDGYEGFIGTCCLHLRKSELLFSCRESRSGAELWRKDTQCGHCIVPLDLTFPSGFATASGNYWSLRPNVLWDVTFTDCTISLKAAVLPGLSISGRALVKKNIHGTVHPTIIKNIV
jgi:hypothetical protein